MKNHINEWVNEWVDERMDGWMTIKGSLLELFPQSDTGAPFHGVVWRACPGGISISLASQML